MMREIRCSIINDILPLYVDGVVSNDTKEMVEEHLRICDECKKEATMMKKKVAIPAERDAKVIKEIKKKIRNKKFLVSVASVLFTAIFLIGISSYVLHYDKVITYTEGLLEIEVQDDNTLISKYKGKAYYSYHATHPFEMEIDGKQKNVVFIYYTKTIAQSPTKNILGGKNDNGSYVFQLGNKDDIDIVYYAPYDIREIAENGQDWTDVLDEAVLIWGN